MTGLIILIILIPIVFLILLITILNKATAQNDLLESLSDKIKKLNYQLDDLSRKLQDKEERPAKPLFRESIQKPIQETPSVKEEVVVIKPPEDIPGLAREKSIQPEVVATREEMDAEYSGH
jgi:hypothetical protein